MDFGGPHVEFRHFRAASGSERTATRNQILYVIETVNSTLRKGLPPIFWRLDCNLFRDGFSDHLQSHKLRGLLVRTAPVLVEGHQFLRVCEPEDVHSDQSFAFPLSFFRENDLRALYSRHAFSLERTRRCRALHLGALSITTVIVDSSWS